MKISTTHIMFISFLFMRQNNFQNHLFGVLWNVGCFQKISQKQFSKTENWKRVQISPSSNSFLISFLINNCCIFFTSYFHTIVPCLSCLQLRIITDLISVDVHAWRHSWRLSSVLLFSFISSLVLYFASDISHFWIIIFY